MQPKPKLDENICVPRDIVLQAAMIRLGNIEHEIQAGYNVIRKFRKTVTMFGSARTPEDNAYYQKAKDLASKLARDGYAVITGGGHGIMEAGNQGAKEAGGDAVGFNIRLPHEQSLNKHATDSVEFDHFAPRKIVMTLYADAYIYFPGGFGTLDELSEILTLIQTGKTVKAPIILVGHDYWDKFDEFVQQSLLQNNYISPGDNKLYTITDSINEAYELVKSNQTYCY